MELLNPVLNIVTDTVVALPVDLKQIQTAVTTITLATFWCLIGTWILQGLRDATMP